MSTEVALTIVITIIFALFAVFVDPAWIMDGAGNIAALLFWSLACASLGACAGLYISKRDMNEFRDVLVERRIAAIDAFKPALNKMIAFEKLGILNDDPEFADPRIDELFTISALHGMQTATEHFMELSGLIGESLDDLSLEQKAAVTCLHQLQFNLLNLGTNFPDDQQDYCFAMISLPIAEELKEYIRDLIGLLDKNLNNGEFKAESVKGEKWTKLFSAYSKKTEAMLSTVQNDYEAILGNLKAS